jgi:hypothetical protein
MEVTSLVVLEDDRLAVDQRLLRREAANRLLDPGKAIGEVGAAPGPDVDALALFAGKDAEAVVFYFVQPAGFGGRAIGERGLARADEAGGNTRSPAFMAEACNASPASMRIAERGPECAVQPVMRSQPAALGATALPAAFSRAALI